MNAISPSFTALSRSIYDTLLVFAADFVRAKRYKKLNSLLASILSPRASLERLRDRTRILLVVVAVAHIVTFAILVSLLAGAVRAPLDVSYLFQNVQFRG